VDPVSCLLAQLRFPLQSQVRDRERNSAMDAICLHGKRRLRIKLLGKRPLNQLPSLSGAMGDRWHVHAAFFPIELKPGLATFSHGFEPPSNGEAPIRLLKCAVFDRIGCQLVHDHRKCLDYA